MYLYRMRIELKLVEGLIYRSFMAASWLIEL